MTENLKAALVERGASYFDSQYTGAIHTIMDTALELADEHGPKGHGYPDVSTDLAMIRKEFGQLGLTELWYLWLHAWSRWALMAHGDADEATLGRVVACHFDHLKPAGGKYSLQAVQLLIESYAWRPEQLLTILRDRVLPRQYTECVATMMLLEIRLMAMDALDTTEDADRD